MRENETAQLLAVAYGDAIWNGDEAALDQAIALAEQAREIRLLPECPRKSEQA